MAAEWDISTISAFATVTNVTYRFDVTAITLPGICDYSLITYQPSIAGTSVQTLWDDIIGVGSDFNYVTGNTSCQTVANDYVLDLGTAADSQLQSQLNEGWFAIGTKYSNMVRNVDQHSSTFGAAATHELQVTYTLSPPSETDCEDPIDDLHYTTLTGTTANLAWTTPTLNGQTLLGYQINYTTPHATPLTILVNNTSSAITTYTASGLTINTDYSFRVQPQTTADCHTPADGNILNLRTSPGLTIGSIPSNFTSETNPVFVGDSQDGLDQTGCFFTREDLNATSIRLNVTYPYTFNPALNFHYKYAMTNNTYLNPTVLPESPTHNKSSIYFNGVDNEIIDVRFWNENTNQTCKYIITQTQFEFLNLINDFRGGEFGTSGDFGVIDLVTLLVIILSQIGFNRLSPIVGGIFLVFTVGGVAVMGLVSWPTVVIAAIAVLIMVVVASSKRD